ncbi:IclR family transcriptional regulator domain-containing protein [Marinobacterium rhizophilum]|uniref:IclR family transcriptional regulator domain-containing protein n=1 Tax=Marinobacterium rhizophilum TaxID=420402 RepID=UPI00038259A5|nr:IclR family transcriptional regulator C-terminal domain-containing protein [Marinobacterium rhizophilum]
MVKSIRALSRGLEVVQALQLLSPASLEDLHRTTGLAKATLLRILQTLQESNWVYRRLGDDRYRLSYNLQQLSDSIISQDALAQIAAPVLARLQKEVQWPSELFVRKGLKLEIIETTRTQSPFLINRVAIGLQTSVIWSGVGRAYLSFCSDTERNEILERLALADTDESPYARDHTWIDRLVQETRARGYGVREPHWWGHSVDYGGYLNAIAVPVFAEERLRACISIVWLENAVDEEIIGQKFYPALCAAATELGARLEQELY